MQQARRYFNEDSAAFWNKELKIYSAETMYITCMMINLIRSTHVVKETTIIQDYVAHHKFTNTIRSCTSMAASMSYTIGVTPEQSYTAEQLISPKDVSSLSFLCFRYPN